MLEEPPGSAEASPEVDWREVWAGLSTEELVEQAVQHRDAGDHLGADERLVVALERGDLADEVAYQQAVLLELDEDYAGAIRHYDEVLAMAPEGSRAHDAAFRRAICLEDLGRHDESLTQVEALKAVGRWSSNDRRSLELSRGIAELRIDRQRRGRRRIEQSLRALDGTHDITWLRARATAALLEADLAGAAETSVTFDRRLRRNLRRRAEALVLAESRIVGIAKLNEPEYVLRGLIDLGDGYTALANDLAAARSAAGGQVPTSIARYRPFEGPRGSVLLDKAFQTYDQGVALAERLDWQGSDRTRLHERREALAVDASGGLSEPAASRP